ncbi:MAG: hypothetical protein ACRDD1_07110, partial [Planctomycetia bacterium]
MVEFRTRRRSIAAAFGLFAATHGLPAAAGETTVVEQFVGLQRRTTPSTDVQRVGATAATGRWTEIPAGEPNPPRALDVAGLEHHRKLAELPPAAPAEIRLAPETADLLARLSSNFSNAVADKLTEGLQRVSVVQPAVVQPPAGPSPFEATLATTEAVARIQNQFRAEMNRQTLVVALLQLVTLFGGAAVVAWATLQLKNRVAGLVAAPAGPPAPVVVHLHGFEAKQGEPTPQPSERAQRRTAP